MYTIFEDNERVFDSLKAGATGYILKNTSPKKIVEALKELAAGGAPMTAQIARKVLLEFSQNQLTKKNDLELLELSDRELQVLQALSKGLLYKEIALELNIAIGTVKQHIHKIYKKLQVNNRTEAINKFNRIN
jgi:DNA-binding NarL/FixJ family response regulator